MTARRLLWFAASLLLAADVCHSQITPGNALRFNGTNGFATVPHDAALNSFPITITAWVRTARTSSAVDGIVSKYFDGSFNGYSLNLRNGRLYCWYLRGGGSINVAP